MFIKITILLLVLSMAVISTWFFNLPLDRRYPDNHKTYWRLMQTFFVLIMLLAVGSVI